MRGHSSPGARRILHWVCLVTAWSGIACGGQVGRQRESTDPMPDAAAPDAAPAEAAASPIVMTPPLDPPPPECIPECLVKALGDCLPAAPAACVVEPGPYESPTLCDPATGRRFETTQGPRGTTWRTLRVDGNACFQIRSGGDLSFGLTGFAVGSFTATLSADHLHLACGPAIVQVPDGGFAPELKSMAPIVGVTPDAPECAGYDLATWPMGCGTITEGHCD